MLQDIRHMMPQQDPNKAKPYEFREYPKMMTYDEGKKKIPYKHPNGAEVIVNSKSEEDEFLRDLKAGHADIAQEKPTVPPEPRAENKIIAKKNK